MKIEKRDGSHVRRILTAMIVDDVVCNSISARFNKQLFESSWANLIAGWCFKYFEKYEHAPGSAIEGLFESWSASKQDKESANMISTFLGSLSDEYENLAEDTNSQYILDTAAEYFNRTRLSRLADSIQGDIDSGELEKARARVSKYEDVEIGGGEGIDILHDKAAIKAAFKERGETLIKYPGAYGKFLRNAFERDAFIAIEGPEKRGKTFRLIDFGYVAMLQRKRVAFFEVGDMSQNQIMRRLMTRASGRPVKASRVRYPTKIELLDEKEAEVKFTTRTFSNDLTWQKAWKACQNVITTGIKSRKPLFKLVCVPAKTINVADIMAILMRKVRAGWAPDVVIVDYADILAPMPGATHERRDQIDDTWAALRSLAQSLHCCVITATQTKATSYKADLIDMTHVADDKRKHAHVTGMLALNQNSTEKDRQVMRLNWVMLREHEINERECVHVAGCLPICNPSVISTL